MLSSPHIEIKHRVSCSGHAILSGVLSMRGLVTARQAFTRHIRTEPARVGPARCGGPGQHGSARVYTTITNRADPGQPGYKCSCKRGISLAKLYSYLTRIGVCWSNPALPANLASQIFLLSVGNRYKLYPLSP